LEIDVNGKGEGKEQQTKKTQRVLFKYVFHFLSCIKKRLPKKYLKAALQNYYLVRSCITGYLVTS
jgi:hypothetical protein